jgi:CHAT domain-containing protein
MIGGEKVAWRWLSAARVGLAFCMAAAAWAADDPLVLQQRAVERIDAFVDHFRRTGDYRSRVADLRQAEAELTSSNGVLAARGDWAGVAHGLVRLGQIARMQSNWDAAAARYREAEAAAQRARDPVLQARVFTGFALAEVSRRNLGAAAGYASKAIPLAEAGGDGKYLFDALDVAGQIQIAQGDLNAAAETLNRALAEAKGIRDESRLFYGYLDHADVYLKRAERCDYERDFAVCLDAVNRARTDYTEALRIARQLGYAGLAAMTEGFLRDVGVREQLVRSRAEGDRLVSETGAFARVFAPKAPKDVLVTERFAPKSELPAGIEAIYQMAKAAEAQAGGFASTVAARSRYVDGLIRQSRGEHDSAIASFLDAVRLLERDRGQLRDERDRGTFFEDKVEFYHAAILELLEQRRHAEAFELMERSRARVMADLLASRSPALSLPKDRVLYAESLQLRSQIAARQGSLLALAADPKAGAERAQIAQENEKLERQYEALLARIAREAPRVGELLVSQPASLSALQQSMRREGYEMLEYLVLEHAVILWHVSADAVRVRNVFLPRSQLIEKVRKLGDSLSDRNRPFDERTARELFLFLVQPAKEWIRSERLVVIPHEDLNYLPFQALPDPADGRYLGERYALSVAPSATVLLALKRAAPTAGASALAVADPDLVAGQDEAQAVARLYAPRSKLMVEPLAQEADLKRWAGEYDVLHLSVHGKFRESEPLLSYLKLARGGADDGELTAAEMFGLPLARSRLVVLSACETGKVRATHANELLGMQRALLYAGASTLVLSYWPVDSDATAAFMQAFHLAAQSTAPPAAAREALKAVKAKTAYAHPYHWAAFMVVGR